MTQTKHTNTNCYSYKQLRVQDQSTPKIKKFLTWRAYPSPLIGLTIDWIQLYNFVKRKRRMVLKKCDGTIEVDL